MSDVRLTATNPEDSSVVPVACNAKGELKLEEPILPEFDGNLDGDLTATGDGTFGGTIHAKRIDSDNTLYNPVFKGTTEGKNTSYLCANGQFFFGEDVVPGSNGAIRPDGFKIRLHGGNGSAFFQGDVIVGSRSKTYALTEQGGLCHMVEQSTYSATDPAPELRDVFAELDVVEKALGQVMEKLRMVEPDGWPVWDGSSNS